MKAENIPLMIQKSKKKKKEIKETMEKIISHITSINNSIQKIQIIFVKEYCDKIKLTKQQIKDALKEQINNLELLARNGSSKKSN